PRGGTLPRGGGQPHHLPEVVELHEHGRGAGRAQPHGHSAAIPDGTRGARPRLMAELFMAGWFTVGRFTAERLMAGLFMVGGSRLAVRGWAGHGWAAARATCPAASSRVSAS